MYNSASDPASMRVLSTNAGITDDLQLKYENDLWTIGKFGVYNPSGHALEFAPGVSEEYIIKQIHRLKKNRCLE